MGTDLVGSLRTDLDSSIETDLDSSLRTDLDRSVGTDLNSSLRTNLVSSLRTDLNGSSGTDLVSSLRTDLDGSSGTDLVSSLRTDLNGSSGTDLVSSQATDLVWPLGNRSSLTTLQPIQSITDLTHQSQTMATTIEQQMALDEALLPSTQRLRIGRNNFRFPSDIQSKESTLQVVYDILRSCPFFKAFLVTADVPKIYMQEFWAIAYVHQHSIRFKLENKKHIVNLETFRDMLHICPRIPGQSIDELPFEEEILEFHRDDIIFSTINVVSRHQNTQQYGAMLPIELTNKEIRNSKAYKEYYACATREAAPKPKASAKRKRSGSDTSITHPTAITTPTTIGVVTPRLTAAAKGKQPAKAKSPFDPSKLARTEAQQLKIVLRRSRQETHIFQHGGSDTDEGTSSKPGVLDVPSDDSEEKISWNSSDDEDVDAQEKNRDDDEGDERDEKERLTKEEEVDELYRDVDINQGRGLPLSQDIEDSHVTLTPVNPDGQQESSSVSSQFVTSILNPTSDVGMESIFATASSPVAPL
nr:hypothetical protein [Tanacetum cinerariifolium]